MSEHQEIPPQDSTRGLKLPRTVHNQISYLGAAIAVLGIFGFLLLLGLDLVLEQHNAYSGLVLFLVLPPIVIFGLLLIPFGMMLEWRHRKRTGEASLPRLPQIDLNLARHRNAAFIFVFGSIFIGAFMLAAGYEGYHYTESTQFCGQLCHVVMEPEYVSYQGSSHARVACVSCHVGPGAGWYVKSKLSGLYQVYAVLFNKYPRPIDTPIHNLRPAQETCQQCHWPDAFWGGTGRDHVYYLSDEKNTRWTVRLLVKTGGNEPGGKAEGIHWHMNVGNKIEYLALDDDRLEIPWVRMTDLASGKARTFTTPDFKGPVDESKVRTMDCMDCHNRPSHRLQSPMKSVDQALEAGLIDRNLPNVRSTAVAALAAEYATKAEAMNGIETAIRQQYEGDTKHEAAINQAIQSVQDIYSKNFFPEMKVRWTDYPENDGHMEFLGCARCHGGNHKDEAQKPITTDCRSCHEILAQGEDGKMEYAKDMKGLDFKHPGGMEDVWPTMPCSDCHTGS